MLSARQLRSTAAFAALCLSALICLIAATQASAAAPVITGKPSIDTSPFLSIGGWAEFDGVDFTSDQDTDMDYQWYLCSAAGKSCIKLLGEDDSEIEFLEGWAGRTLRLRVTVSNVANINEFATVLSDPVGPLTDAGTGATSGAILNHGTVQLGVNPEADLVVDGGIESASGDRSSLVGLRFAPLNLESISDGSPAEGWGVADPDANVGGWANRNDSGPNGLELVDFAKTADTATSTVDLRDDSSAQVLRVTHAYKPSSSSNLFEADVTITNFTSATIDHTRYRRVVDWDIQPTPFHEFVTIQGGNSPALIDATDDGFSSANPLNSLQTCDHGYGDVVDSGPGDCGAAFDFDFGALAPDESKTFKLYYGAAADEATALSALNAVGAEAYSLGQSATELGALTGSPATFILAFSDIGGDPLIPDATEAGDTVIDTSPATHSQNAEPDFTFHNTNNGVDFQCSLDGDGWTACNTPITALGPLDEGWHNFRIRGVVLSEDDPPAVISAESTPAASNFKVDTTKPATGIELDGPNPAITSSPKFRFYSEVEDSALELTYECSFDDSPWTDCTEGRDLTDVTPADHQLLVRATDLAGNVESPAKAYEWTYSYTAPPVTTITTPGGLVYSNSLTINFAATGQIAEYRCSLDGGRFNRCVAPFDVTDLDAGPHLFKVYATATNGLADVSPKELAFEYTTAAPPTNVFPLPAAAKPSGKLGKLSKKGVVKLTAVCNEAVCKVTASVKIGKKKYKLKGKALAKGASTVKLTFNKKLKKALKKKKRKKATLTVVLSSSAGSTTVRKKF